MIRVKHDKKKIETIKKVLNGRTAIVNRKVLVNVFNTSSLDYIVELEDKSTFICTDCYKEFERIPKFIGGYKTKLSAMVGKNGKKTAYIPQCRKCRKKDTKTHLEIINQK